MTFVSETKELIKAVAERMIVGGASLVPFANQAGGVATAKRFGDGDSSAGMPIPGCSLTAPMGLNS